MNTGVCVGAVSYDGKFVRLLDSKGYNQPENCPFKINEIYDITFIHKQNPKPPHTEDILVLTSKYEGKLEDGIRMIDFITERNVNICYGSIDKLFENCLNFTYKGSGYINSARIPQNSVSFWIADKDLIKDIDYNDKIKYEYSFNDYFGPCRLIKYVGLQPAEDIITKGTLLRVSLARWWSHNEQEVENRCYLQLSGWYK
jgi:hypothetical protein